MLGRFLSIYKTCIKTAVAQAAADRLNFAFSLFIALSFNIMFPLVTILIYGAGASFPGWNVYEALLLQSVFLLSSGLSYLVWEGIMYTTMEHVRDGNLEVVLLKPLSPLFFLTATSFSPESFGTLIGAAVLFIFSLSHTGLTLPGLIRFIPLFAAGFCVLSGVHMIMAAISFKWVGNYRIPEIFNSILNFGKYPIGIFPGIIKSGATYVIPVAMIACYPAEALLNRHNTAVFIVAVSCAVFMFFGAWLYEYMVCHYKGVGG